MELDRWLAGDDVPPNIYFLRAVDIVLQQDSIEPSVPGDLPLPGKAADTSGKPKL